MKLEFNEFSLTDFDDYLSQEAFTKDYHFVLSPVTQNWEFAGYAAEMISRINGLSTFIGIFDSDTLAQEACQKKLDFLLEYERCLETGKKYIATGNIKVF